MLCIILLNDWKKTTFFFRIKSQRKTWKGSVLPDLMHIFIDIKLLFFFFLPCHFQFYTCWIRSSNDVNWHWPNGFHESIRAEDLALITGHCLLSSEIMEKQLLAEIERHRPVSSEIQLKWGDFRENELLGFYTDLQMISLFYAIICAKKITRVRLLTSYETFDFFSKIQNSFG